MEKDFRSHHNHIEYRDSYKKVLDDIELQDSGGRSLGIPDVIHEIAVLLSQKPSQPRVYFIGNGGSAAIASHKCANFIKYFGIPAHCFNDGPLLTCFSNDYGYKEAFERLIKIFVQPGDILFAISSSGASLNILRGTQAARELKALVVTLSGFETLNPLRKLGDYNFYVPSNSYRYVESAHLHILDYLVDYGIKLMDAAKK